jgi:hypothetical protein
LVNLVVWTQLTEVEWPIEIVERCA